MVHMGDILIGCAIFEFGTRFGWYLADECRWLVAAEDVLFDIGLQTWRHSTLWTKMPRYIGFNTMW